MSYIPLHAKRRIAFYRAHLPRMREQMLAICASTRVPNEVRKGKTTLPKRLDIEKDSLELCSSINVWFRSNTSQGFIRQLACKVADVEEGYIIRFTKARGSLVSGKGEERLAGQVLFTWR